MTRTRPFFALLLLLSALVALSAADCKVACNNPAAANNNTCEDACKAGESWSSNLSKYVNECYIRKSPFYIPETCEDDCTVNIEEVLKEYDTEAKKHDAADFDLGILPGDLTLKGALGSREKIDSYCRQLTTCRSAYKKFENTLSTLRKSNCLDFGASTDKIAHSLKCREKGCTQKVDDVVAELDKYKDLSECTEFYKVKSAEVSAIAREDFEIIEALRPAVMDMCNECALQYQDMTVVKDKLFEGGCLPSPTNVDCSEMCLSLVQEYTAYYDLLIGKGVCHESMPGGCGLNGGKSEGDIYNELKEQFSLFSSFRSLTAQCDPKCKKAYRTWYRQIATVARSKSGGQRCLDFGEYEIGSSKNAHALATFPEITSSCTDHCMELVQNRIARRFYMIPKDCRVENVQLHFHQFRELMSDCDAVHASTGAILTDDLVINVVVVLLLFFLCLLAAFCLITATINYFRGYRGIDAFPNVFYWKRLITFTKDEDTLRSSEVMQVFRRSPASASVSGSSGSAPVIPDDEESLVSRDERGGL